MQDRRYRRFVPGTLLPSVVLGGIGGGFTGAFGGGEMTFGGGKTGLGPVITLGGATGFGRGLTITAAIARDVVAIR